MYRTLGFTFDHGRARLLNDCVQVSCQETCQLTCVCELYLWGQILWSLPGLIIGSEIGALIFCQRKVHNECWFQFWIMEHRRSSKMLRTLLMRACTFSFSIQKCALIDLFYEQQMEIYVVMPVHPHYLVVTLSCVVKNWMFLHYAGSRTSKPNSFILATLMFIIGLHHFIPFLKPWALTRVTDSAEAKWSVSFSHTLLF